MKNFFKLFGILLLCAWQIATAQTQLRSTELKSGYIAVTAKDHLFYLLAKSKAPNAPLVIFFAGGPGASSLISAFVANGPIILAQPFHHDTHFQLQENPWSWNNIANVVYLDQPRYVGYSYGHGRYVTSVAAAGRDFLHWLQLFYQQHPEFKRRSLYLSGESFGAVYIAENAHQILQYNTTHPDNHIPLSGVFIQSGAISDDDRHGFDVSPSYQLDFLCTQKFLPQSACALNKKNNLRDTLTLCLKHLSVKNHIALDEIKITDLYMSKPGKFCQQYLHQVINQPTKMEMVILPNSVTLPKQLRGKSIKMPINSLEFAKNSLIRQYLGYSPGPWNMNLACQPSGGFPPWCYDNYKLTQFFNRGAIKLQLTNHLTPKNVHWEFSKFLIPATLIDNKPEWPVEANLAEILSNQIPVVLVYGKDDYSTDYVGAEVLANKIALSAYNQPLFSQLPEKISNMNSLLIDKNQPIGEYQSLRNLTFAQINDAGHMVGMDQPEIIYQLFFKLLNENAIP